MSLATARGLLRAATDRGRAALAPRLSAGRHPGRGGHADRGPSGFRLGRHADPDLVDPPGRGRRCGGRRHRVPRPGFDRRHGGDRVRPGRARCTAAAIGTAACREVLELAWRDGASAVSRGDRPPTTSRPAGCWSRPASRHAMTASSRYVDDRRCEAMTGGQGSTGSSGWDARTASSRRCPCTAADPATRPTAGSGRCGSGPPVLRPDRRW